MASPRVPLVELGGGRPASGDSARAALVNPVSATEAQNRLKGPGGIGALLEGGAKLAFTAAAHMKKMDVDRDQIMAVEVEGQVMRAIDDEKSKLDPMASDYASQIKEIVTRHTQGAMESAQFRTREVKDETTRRLTRIGAASELVAAEDRRKSIAGEAERVYTERLESLYGAIRKDPDGADTHMAAFQADAQRLRSGISPDRMRIISHAAADGMLAAKVEGYAQKGNFAGAKKFLADNSGSFKPETNRSLNAYINSQEAHQRGLYALSSADAAGRTAIEIQKQSFDPDARQTVTVEELDRRIASGRIRPQDAVGLYGALLRGNTARQAVIERNRVAVDNYERKTMTPADADIMFRLAQGAAIERRGGDKSKLSAFDSPEGMEALDLVAKEGIVPPMVAQQIENLANQGGPGGGDMEIANLAKATTAYKMLRDKYPNVAGLKQNDRMDLVIEQAKANGGDIVQAARDVMKQLPADPKMDALRVEDGRKLARETNWEAEGRTVLGTWFERQFDTAESLLRTGARLTPFRAVVTPGEDAASLPPLMLHEMRVNFERNFRLSGDEGRARAAAVEQVKREWTVTHVAGDKTPYVMKNAPASFLPPERAWFKDDLDKTMAEATIKLLKAQGWAPVSDRVRGAAPAYVLEADPRTLAEAAAKDPARPPTFVIKTLREDRQYHITGRIAMPTEDEIRQLPAFKSRGGDFDAAKAAQDARDALERRAKDKADKRRGR